MLAIVMSAISVNYTVIQETRIPIEMCAAETCIIDEKHTSLVKCVRETHIPRDTCAGHIIPGETRTTMTTEKIGLAVQDTP